MTPVDYMEQPLAEGDLVEAWWDMTPYRATVESISAEPFAPGLYDVTVRRVTDGDVLETVSSGVTVVTCDGTTEPGWAVTS